MKIIIKILLISFLPFCGFSQMDTIVWQQKSSLPSTPRVSCASFAIDSNYFIIGGLDAGSNWYSEVWKYNIPSDNWSRMKDFPGGPIAGAFGFSINLHGFVCLGSDSISMYNGDNQFWEYYPAVDTWQHKVNYPGVARDYPVGFIYNQYAYVGMGRGPGATDLWRYNALSDNWDSVSSLPSLYRVNQGTSVIDSFAYILGGSNFTAILNDIWRYNMKADHWDSIGIIPGGLREGAFYGTLDSTIIIGYGFVVDTIGSSPGENMAQDIYSYYPYTNRWDTLKCINFPDSIGNDGSGCFLFGKTAYFFGGFKSANPNYIYYNNMWSFDASRFLPADTSTGIAEVKDQVSFAVHPNPVNRDKGFSISTSLSGSIVFYDELGRIVDERKLMIGINSFKLNIENEVIFYRAILDGGVTENGKIVCF